MKKYLVGFLSGIFTGIILGVILANIKPPPREDISINSIETLVQYEIIEKKLFEHYVEVQGIVKAQEIAFINPEVNGSITNIFVKPGEKVIKGQDLASLNTAILRSNLQEAEKNYELVSAMFDKQKLLWEQNIGTELQFLEIKTRKESLEQSLTTLKLQLNKGSITAPFAGQVDEIFAKVGELASPMQPLMRLVSTSKLYVEADVPENYFNKINEKNKVEVVAPGADISFAEVTSLGRYIEPNNRSFKVYIDLKNQHLLPNMTVLLRIRDHVQDSALTIPSRYILNDAKGKNYVYVLQNESDTTYRALKKEVTLGLNYNGECIIHKGVQENEMMVTEGSRSIVDREVVKVIGARNIL